MDADGMALMFWVGVAGLVALVLAGGIEQLLSRPDRGWVRKLRELERARVAWEAKVIAEQAFFKREKQ